MYGEALQIYYEKKAFFLIRFNIRSQKMLSPNAILNIRNLHIV
jgi:hypothetical protein